MAESERVSHTLSPSAWNRFETCPRQYWLSRQKLPRKAGMAASLGTIVHASVEDLLQMDLSGRDNSEIGWLGPIAEKFLRTRWEEEKQIFHKTPRRPKWKEEDFPKAKRQQRGAIRMLLRFIGSPEIANNKVSIAHWRKLHSRVIAVEGELRTSDDRLMGRLDMLLADVDESGNLRSWVVADLKTGRVPEGGVLKPEVHRQLLLYRDILDSNNQNAPPIRAEGWYTDDAGIYTAEGDSVMADALKAWEATKPSDVPLEATPGEKSCGGFCDWKAWCPHWWNWRAEGGGSNSDFKDIVVLLHHYDSVSGGGVAEMCEPADEAGRVLPTGLQMTINFDNRGKEALEELLEKGHKGPIFVGSAMMKRGSCRVGHWCDVLAWSPIPDA